MSSSNSSSIRIAVEGCGHGCLHDIYASVEKAAALKGWDGVDLLIIGGDFQAVRNSNDMACMSVPQKYKELGDFHEYYSGKRTAPYLTIFIAGNHEASSHLFELYYGGWAAPNIYFMGAANVLRCGPVRIAAMSGIWKGYDYRKPHFERIPYNRDDIHSIYHIRELDVRKLLQIRSQVDIGLSHDWPSKVEYSGDYERLFRQKPLFRADSQNGKLGSQAARYALDRLRPAYWFSAHLHVRFVASVQHAPHAVQGQQNAAPHSFGLDGTTFTSMVLGEEEPTNSGDTANDRPKYIAPIFPNDDERNPPTGEHPMRQGNENLPADPVSESKVTEEVSMQGAPVTTKSKLSAWQNFHEVAAKNEVAENSRFLSEHKTNQEAALNMQHNLTWRKIDLDEDGFGRKLTGIETSRDAETRESKKQKTQHDPQPVRNSDEIELDLDSDSDQEPETETPLANPTADKTPSEPEEVPKEPQHSEIGVSQELRNQLPASFARPQASSAPVNAPFPEAISNVVTNFLALDKCLPKRDFLQLIEINAISDQEGAQFERPFRLQYDKEWLAITRVFAQDLHLGDPSARPSPDKGDAIYRPQIIEEEKWIEEHVVKPKKLDVPENFTPTAPFYDPSVPITTDQGPIEYNNPQTATFCDLIGIENKFHLSDEQRQARMDIGPRPCADQGGNMNRFQGRRGGFGGRGAGGGGGGRGHGRGGYGSRGRGRGGRR
ncbi:hypothetical protein ARAM_002341 [Aspergillus rambellii]|uniref:Lariat debranching enzyme C-terminal domain-containing protein n=1 Tax=Aspergillus rambellii TaxID=308745 RepID=A0A0F8TY35_9EURO|nr:hypothetical protein ARAM_002341 [Aspergillus rambellii]